MTGLLPKISERGSPTFLASLSSSLQPAYSGFGEAKFQFRGFILPHLPFAMGPHPSFPGMSTVVYPGAN